MELLGMHWDWGYEGCTYGLVERHLWRLLNAEPLEGLRREMRRWRVGWFWGQFDGGLGVLGDGEGRKIWLRTGRRNRTATDRIAKGLEVVRLFVERADCSLQKVERGAVPGIGLVGCG